MKVNQSAKSAKSAESVDPPSEGRMDRREALKAMVAASGALPILEQTPAQGPQGPPAQGTPMTSQTQGFKGGPRGGPWDPNLLRPKKDWPRKLNATELATLTALVDVIIPADEKSPAASAVGVPAWINEYVSAPYDGQQRDLVRVRGGLAWINQEAVRRFGKSFQRSSPEEKTQICDEICYLPKAKPGYQAAARFFDLVRDLTAVGFYTSFEGMRDIGYIGNVALPKFPEVSAEIRAKLGL